MPASGRHNLCFWTTGIAQTLKLVLGSSSKHADDARSRYVGTVPDILGVAQALDQNPVTSEGRPATWAHNESSVAICHTRAAPVILHHGRVPRAAFRFQLSHSYKCSDRRPNMR